MLQAVGISLVPGRIGTVYPGGKKAACCMSLDFDVTRETRAEANRKGTYLILQLAEKNEIPLTWAICGMTAEKDPEPFRAVLDSGVGHEIASHTYSHLRVDTATPAELDDDFEKWRSVVGETSPKTFIFPYNREGNFETLKRQGFIAFRGEGRRISPPYLESGFCNIPPVMYLSGRSDGTVETARGFIELSVRYRSVFHLWSHPWNLAREGSAEKYSEEVLTPIFSHLKEKEKEGRLGLYTMGQLAEFGKNSGSGLAN